MSKTVKRIVIVLVLVIVALVGRVHACAACEIGP